MQYQPLLGCAPSADERAAAYHQRWLVGDDNGAYLSPADCPALTNIDVQLSMGYLVLRAPGMLRLDIPLDVIEDDESVCSELRLGDQRVKVVDEGNLAAAWLSNHLGCVARLYKVHPDVQSWVAPVN